MITRLQDEIKQSRPFDSLQEETLLNLLRTAAVLGHRMETHFRPWGITATQFNVLRIVRGAGPHGISQCDVAERLVAQTPDVPRLLQRTEEAGLIVRETNPDDRRMRLVTLTHRGDRLLHELDSVLPSLTGTFFERLTSDDLGSLNRLLADSR